MSLTIAARCDGPLSRFRGAIGREPAPGEAVLFEFARPASRHFHGVGLRAPVQCVWLVDGVVTQTTILSPWSLGTSALADTVLETSPGTLDVALGDRVEITERTIRVVEHPDDYAAGRRAPAYD